MMPLSARNRLEPLAGPAAAVILAHVLLGCLAWIFLPYWLGPLPGDAGDAVDPNLKWLPPAHFLAVVDEPPPPAVRKPPQSKAEPSPPPPVPAPRKPPARAANKYITLSPRMPEAEGPSPPPKPYEPVPSLLQIASVSEQSKKLFGADMRPVDEAIQQTCLKEWSAPSTHLVPPGQRTAVVNLSVEKDGTISDVTLIKTGAPALNVSIVQMFQRVMKIPMRLPSNFRNPRYDLQVNFQIE